MQNNEHAISTNNTFIKSKVQFSDVKKQANVLSISFLSPLSFLLLFFVPFLLLLQRVPLWLWHPWIAPVLGSPLSSFLVTEDDTIEGLLVFFKSCPKEEVRKPVLGGKSFTFAVLCCLQELGKLTDVSSQNNSSNIYKKYSHKGNRRY